MPLLKLLPKPGIVKDVTEYSSEGFWYDCDKMRFRLGYPEVIGGWTAYANAETIYGTCRSMLQWTSLSLERFIGLGTNQKYYIESGGYINDITPIRSTVSLGNNPFETQTAGTSLMKVTTTSAHGAIEYDWVTFSGATGFDGYTADQLNVEVQITEIIDATSFYVVFPAGATVTPSTAGGGSGVSAAFQISVGLNTQVYSTGWGSGAWGRGPWGSAFSPLSPAENLCIWSESNYGQDLVINRRYGPIYYWTASGLDPLNTRAVDLTTIAGANDAPVVASQVLVSDIDRHVIAFGCNDIGSNEQNLLLVRWSSQEDYLDWEPRTDNTAGGFTVSSGSEIVSAIPTQQQILVFTDKALFAMSYTGPPYTFSFTRIGESISIIGPNAGIDARGTVYWMDNNNFYMYSGSVVKMNCPVLSYVFADLDWNQKTKVTAGVNAQFNEVYWWYPCATIPTGENSRYVAYNYVENIWTIGTMDRTAWLDLAADGYPIGAMPNEVNGGGLDTVNTTTSLFRHEYGYTDNGANIDAYVTSGPIDIEDGDNLMFVSRIIPDVQFVNDPKIDNNGYDQKVSMQISGVNYPMSTAGYQTNTVTVQGSAPETTQRNVRIRARQVKLKAESYQGGNPIQKWRLGSNRIQIQPDGMR
jgi:hypothetical protein